MKPLSQALDEYLQLRRSLGFKLRDTGHYLPDFVRFLDDRGASHITTQLAIRWATLPSKARPSHWARRLTMVRLFALHWKAYYPFGHEAQISGVNDVRMKFTGHERDSELGLDYMLARYYGAGLARFMSVDPANAISAAVNGWNRYTYSANNPLLFVDSDGREVELSPGMQSLVDGGSEQFRLAWGGFLSTTYGAAYYGLLDGLPREEYLGTVQVLGANSMIDAGGMNYGTCAPRLSPTGELQGHLISLNFEVTGGKENLAVVILDEFFHALRDKYDVFPGFPHNEAGDHEARRTIEESYRKQIREYLKTQEQTEKTGKEEKDKKEKKKQNRKTDPATDPFDVENRGWTG